MNITILDFDALYACLEKASYISEDVIINVTETNLSINIKNMIARLSIDSMCVTADKPCQIALADVKLFMVALTNAHESIKDAFADKIMIQVTPGKLLIRTNNSKTALQQANVDIIKSAATPINMLPASVIDFTIDKPALKKINSSLIFISNVMDARIEFGQFDDIADTSLIGAKIFATNTPLSNYSVIAVGEINVFNDMKLDYPVCLDFERISLLSRFITEPTKLSALTKPALVFTQKIFCPSNTTTSPALINMTFICSIVK